MTCEAHSREMAEQIAFDVNEDEPHLYIPSTRKIGDLQIVHPLAWDTH
jgi:hypothetical protein